MEFMEEVFASSFFHYTRHGYKILKKIIESGFKVCYCKEVNLAVSSFLGVEPTPGHEFPINLTGTYSSGTYIVHWLHIPMVSFCDLPTHRIEEHLSKYGQRCLETGGLKAYGIGLSRSWAARQNLKQVSYEFVNNDNARKYSQVYIRTDQVMHEVVAAFGNQQIEKYFRPVPIEPNSYWVKDNKGNSFPHEFLYKKPIGLTRRIFGGNTIIKDSDYYRGESEWRYIPKDACIIASYSFHTMTHNRLLYDSVERNAERAINEHLSYQHLRFEPDDVDVIVVDTIEDRDQLQSDLIAIATKNKWGHGKVSELCEKIVAYKELRKRNHFT